MDGSEKWKRHASSAGSAILRSPAIGAGAHDLRGQTGSPAVASNYFAADPSPWPQISTAVAFLALGIAVMVAVLYPRFNDERTAKQDTQIAALRAEFDMMAERTRLAEREARVATERYNDVAKEMVKRGMAVSDH